MTELVPELTNQTVSRTISFQESPHAAKQIENETLLDHATYLSAAASRRLGHITAAVSTTLATGAALELAQQRLAAGSFLTLACATGFVMAHAMTEDAKDKRVLDELTLPYNLRVPPDEQ